MNIFTLAIIDILLIALILCLFKLQDIKYLVKELRNICYNPLGYIKFMQFIFVWFAIMSFIFLMLYFMFRNRDVNVLDIFLTVIVGFLGTIIGFFFNDKMMKKLEEEQEKSIVRSSGKFKQIASFSDKVVKLLEKVK